MVGKLIVACVLMWIIIWLAPLGTARFIPQVKFPRKPYNKSFIDQACLVKMAGYWPCSFFVSLWASTLSVHNHAKNNLANIQPSWPHTWSITHMWYIASQKVFNNACVVLSFQEQMQAKSELSASNKTAQNSVDRLIKFIELVQSLWQPILLFPWNKYW